MVRSRAKSRSTRSQICVNHSGIIICINKNTVVNTGDLKTLLKKNQNKANFPDVTLNFPDILCVLPSMLFMTGEL